MAVGCRHDQRERDRNRAQSSRKANQTNAPDRGTIKKVDFSPAKGFTPFGTALIESLVQEGIDGSEWSLLMLIARWSWGWRWYAVTLHPYTQNELGRMLGWSSSQASKVATRLKHRGLIYTVRLRDGLHWGVNLLWPSEADTRPAHLNGSHLDEAREALPAGQQISQECFPQDSSAASCKIAVRQSNSSRDKGLRDPTDRAYTQTEKDNAADARDSGYEEREGTLWRHSKNFENFKQFENLFVAAYQRTQTAYPDVILTSWSKDHYSMLGEVEWTLLDKNDTVTADQWSAFIEDAEAMMRSRAESARQTPGKVIYDAGYFFDALKGMADEYRIMWHRAAN